jgi:hypothetical protein
MPKKGGSQAGKAEQSDNNGKAQANALRDKEEMPGGRYCSQTLSQPLWYSVTKAPLFPLAAVPKKRKRNWSFFSARFKPGA